MSFKDSDDIFCYPNWYAWESRTSFQWQLFNRLKYQSTILICMAWRSYFLRCSWWFSSSLNTPVKACLNHTAGMRNYSFCHKKKVSVKNSLIKCTWEMSEMFLHFSTFFWSIIRETSWNSAVFLMLGYCSDVLISSWWMDSMRTM